MAEELARLTAAYVNRASSLSALASDDDDDASPPRLAVSAEDVDWRADPARRAAAEARLAKQGPPISAFWRREYETKAAKYWDAFYKRNADRFFRDRHYVEEEFGEALRAALGGPTTTALDEEEDDDDDAGSKLRRRRKLVVELGCGVGNGIAQLVAHYPRARVVCLDFSARAVALLKRRPDFDRDKCDAQVADIVALDPLGAPRSADCVTCFFVLSALEPATAPRVAAKIYDLVRPGGVVLVRDYGRYDEAQLRFSKGRKLDDHFYVKQDGTRCFYFHTLDLDALFPGHLFHGQAVFKCHAHANRATGQVRHRVFVQAIYSRRHTHSWLE